MCKIRTDLSGLSYIIWTDASRTNRSMPLGRQPEVNLDLFRGAWDTALALTEQAVLTLRRLEPDWPTRSIDLLGAAGAVAPAGARTAS